VGVNFVVTRKGIAEHDLHIVSGMNGWRGYWLPATRELGLKIVPHLGDGRYTCFPPDDIPALVAELERLRPWMEARDLLPSLPITWSAWGSWRPCGVRRGDHPRAVRA
jgi:hypothetical protein